jgi:hemerythrin
LTELEIVLGAKRMERAKELGDALMALCHDHCAREKAFLERICYPNAEDILAAQQDSLARVQELIDQMSSPSDKAVELARDMQKALIEYLLKGDINFKSYVEAFGYSDTNRS